ncbi:PREDICTED: sialic acid-binding Ig-like lectin 10 isoform X3 [Capra hircus]|uniref:sialic acid-binding Ig-like lectin 10 isoform X3 n=1 Tax=Capra hircus TaxID=9925 RepID=UPI000846475B|nr:PREDICTED: sialic acid-binding Ig-like lectin 10 isoform X3 [Capra hircus]
MFLPLFLAMLWGGSQALDSFKLQVQEFVMVQEGLCVVVPCSVFYPSRGWSPTTPAYGFWFRDNTPKPSLPVATNKPGQDVDTDTQGRFQLLGDPSQSCSLLIREAHLEDSALYFFRFERGDYVKYNFMEYKFYLEVTALTLKPEIYVPEVLQPGHQVTLFCAFNWIFDECPVPTLSWIGNTVSPNEVSPRTSYFSELTFTPRPQDHNTELTCRVDFFGEGVSAENTVRLSVAYAPENLKVMVSKANRTALENLESGASLQVLEGQSLRLLCVAHSNPPARLSWARQGRTVSPSQPSDPGVLELPQIQTEQEGEFTCRAQNLLGSQNISLSLSVVSPPQLLGPSCSQEDEGLRCSCSSRARPAPSLRWRLGEGLLEGELSNASFEVASSSSGPWANSSLSLREGLSSSLRLSCEALNGHGAQSGSVLLLPDEKGLASGAFSSGISLGIGVTTLLFLCFILILVRTLRKKWTQGEVPAPAPAPGEAPRSRFSRRSTILDYINVIPKAGPLKQKAKPSSPSQPPPPDGHSPEARKNQKELHLVSHNCPGPKSSPQASEAENNQEELHYAVLNFPGLRPWETQRPEGTHPEYAEIQFH